jgi:hypothetical protein
LFGRSQSFPHFIASIKKPAVAGKGDYAGNALISRAAYLTGKHLSTGIHFPSGGISG